jgi:hypothetical protein
MGPDVSTGPPGLRVERRSETNRLATDFQVRAYEELLPMLRRCSRTTAATVQADVAWTPSKRSSQKGVAA